MQRTNGIQEDKVQPQIFWSYVSDLVCVSICLIKVFSSVAKI